MKRYEVSKAKEEELLNLEGVYDVGRENKLVYIDEKMRLFPLKISSEFKHVHKVEREDWSKRYSVYEKGGFEIREISIFENPDMAELTLINRGVELRDSETRKLLDPYNFGIFAPGLTVIKPSRKRV